MAVLGLDHALDGLHLLDRLDAQEVNVVEALVHRSSRPLRVAAGLGPVHRNPRAAPAQAVEPDSAIAGRGDAGADAENVGEITAGQGQFFDLEADRKSTRLNSTLRHLV